MIKLEISTHSGSVDVVKVENFCARDVEERLNTSEVQAIAFGDNVYSKIDIKNIRRL